MDLALPPPPLSGRLPDYGEGECVHALPAKLGRRTSCSHEHQLAFLSGSAAPAPAVADFEIAFDHAPRGHQKVTSTLILAEASRRKCVDQGPVALGDESRRTLLVRSLAVVGIRCLVGNADHGRPPCADRRQGRG